MSAAQKPDAITITVRKDVVDALLLASVLAAGDVILSRSDAPIEKELIEKTLKALLPSQKSENPNAQSAPSPVRCDRMGLETPCGGD